MKQRVQRDVEAQNAVAEAGRPPDFVLDLLAELQRSHYRPIGWWRFLVRSWRQSRATAEAHPALVRSWAGVAALLTGAEALALLLGARRGAGAALATRRAAPWAALLLGAVQFDAYVHLGLNNAAAKQPLYTRLGLANALTLVRHGIASYLWARLLGRQPASRGEALVALALASATDIADGAVARTTQSTTRLGQYLDSEADFSFWAALALTLGARGLLPRWLLALLLGRWLVPMGFAFASYFGWAQRIPIGSTLTGKVAGVTQGAALAAALLPERVSQRLGPGRAALHGATALLLIAAPLAQLVKVARAQTE